jgi:hypothetical protein
MFGDPVLVIVFVAELFARSVSGLLVLAESVFTIEVVGLGKAVATVVRILKLMDVLGARLAVGLQTMVPAMGAVCAIPRVSVI